jgi:hypothetical protein
MNCGKTVDSDIKIEINFVSKMIYWYCTECKSMNHIDINAIKDLNPLPRMRTM